jgi:hypothetical protein
MCVCGFEALGEEGDLGLEVADVFVEFLFAQLARVILL